MSDGEAFRPRRAWEPDEDEVNFSDLDDTPAAASSPARRGAADWDDDDSGAESSPLPEGAQAPSPTGTQFGRRLSALLGIRIDVSADADEHPSEPSSEPVETPWTPDPSLLNPFARPGSDAAGAPIPSETIIPAPVFPRSAGEYDDGPGPAPRRSALSSTTPVEQEAAADKPTPGTWVEHHRRTLTGFAVGGLTLALVVGLISFFMARGTTPIEPSPSPSPSPSLSASASPSPTLEPLTVDSLLLPQDLAGIAPASSWAVTDTTTSAAEHTGRVACLSTQVAEVNPTTSLQRVLATSGDDQLAALHEIDVYASPEAAATVFTERIRALSGCAEVPSYIVRATEVRGLAQHSFQVTVAFQNETTQYHTVLLTRAGSALQVLDFARNDEPVEPEALAEALATPQADLCEREEVDCGEELTVSNAPVPPVEPVGWLIPADLPRIRPAVGRWSAQDPTDVTLAQMGCENMTLATEPGPSSRQQRTYLMTQDDQRPDTFGVDEVMFTFGDAQTAATFVSRLGNNLATCKDRVNTATVTEHPAVPAVGKDGVKVSSRVFTIKQASSDNTAVTYKLIVSAAGTRIMYTLITVTDAYTFTDAQIADLAARIPVRASQLA